MFVLVLMIRAYSSWKSKYLHLNISINYHPCIPLFFETTIMGNTADLAMVQKTIIDTLHKEGKSQRVITERGGSSRSAVSKHIKCKVDWKEEMGRKMCTSNRMTSLRILSSKADSNTWESFTRSDERSWSQCIKSHHAQRSSGKGLQSHF